MAGILLIANRPLASAMAQACTSILGRTPARLAHIDVAENAEPDELIMEVAKHLERLEGSGGVVVLTDLYGSTPDNIARSFVSRGNVSVISGLNLPLLLKACTSEESDLSSLTRDIVDAVENYVVVHLESQA